MFKAAFFDLDDTLLNALPCHVKAYEKAFTSFGVDYNDVREKIKNIDFFGMKIDVILKFMRDVVGKTEEQIPLSELMKVREEFFLKELPKSAILMPGAEAALAYSKSNLKHVAIVSSGSKKYIDVVISQFNLSKYLDFFISGDDCKIGKPNPDCYLKALSRLNDSSIKNTECLVVEDALVGLQAGKAAGMKVLLVPVSYNKNAKKIEGYDFKIDSLLEFETIFS